jgi:hypothetical protein
VDVFHHGPRGRLEGWDSHYSYPDGCTATSTTRLSYDGKGRLVRRTLKDRYDDISWHQCFEYGGAQLARAFPCELQKGAWVPFDPSHAVLHQGIYNHAFMEETYQLVHQAPPAAGRVTIKVTTHDYYARPRWVELLDLEPCPGPRR